MWEPLGWSCVHSPPHRGLERSLQTGERDSGRGATDGQKLTPIQFKVAGKKASHQSHFAHPRYILVGWLLSEHLHSQDQGIIMCTEIFYNLSSDLSKNIKRPTIIFFEANVCGKLIHHGKCLNYQFCKTGITAVEIIKRWHKNDNLSNNFFTVNLLLLFGL